MGATVPPINPEAAFVTEERDMTSNEAFQDVCREIENLTQHGIGTDPAGLASAIDELVDAKIREAVSP